MTDEKISCMSCGKEFVYTEGERLFLEGLLKQKKIPEVITPRKCVPCRSDFRRSKRLFPAARPRAALVPSDPRTWAAHTHPHAAPAFVAPDPASTSPAPPPLAPAAPPATAPGTPTPEEIVILVASDFEALVCRQDVVWRQGNRKITIRLADIGPEALKKAMESAVLHWWRS